MAGLDLKVLEYVYSETISQSLLRKLFVHVSVWYGNEDGFADLTSELPPEFHTKYAVQRARKTHGHNEGMNAWDLTRFLVQECLEMESIGEVEGRPREEQRRDSVIEERKSKRRKS